MKISNIAFMFSAVLTGSLALSSQVVAQGRLVVYCSAQNTMCEQEVQAFEKKYNVKTSFVRAGAGSILAKLEVCPIVECPCFHDFRIILDVGLR